MFHLLARVKFLQRLWSAPTFSSQNQNDSDVSYCRSAIVKEIILRLGTKVHSVAIFVKFSTFLPVCFILTSIFQKRYALNIQGEFYIQSWKKPQFFS